MKEIIVYENFMEKIRAILCDSSFVGRDVYLTGTLVSLSVFSGCCWLEILSLSCGKEP